MYMLYMQHFCGTLAAQDNFRGNEYITCKLSKLMNNFTNELNYRNPQLNKKITGYKKKIVPRTEASISLCSIQIKNSITVRLKMHE